MTYSGDGSTVQYALPFGYITRADISATVDGVSTSFTWADSSTAEFSSAPSNGAVIRFERASDIDDRPVNFTSAVVSKSALDTGLKHIFYLLQEMAEGSNVLDFYTEAQVDTLLATKSATSHNHNLNDLTEKSYNSLDNKPSHSDITDDEAGKHREINDSGTGATELWSASKINTEVSAKADSTHTHDKVITVTLCESDEDIVTGNGTIGIPGAAVAGYELSAVGLTCTTKGSSGTTTAQVRRSRAGSDNDMLSSAVSLGDAYWQDSTSIDTGYDDCTDGDTLFIDVDTVRTGMRGVTARLVFTYAS